MNIKINNKIIKINILKTFLKKLKGLMFKKETIKEGYLFINCNSIHTFFMKQNIDLCITDKNNKIIFIKENIPKNKIIWPIKHGYYTYELPLNTVKYLKINETIKKEKI